MLVNKSNKKNNARTNTNFSFSSQVHVNNPFLQGQTETIHGQSNSVFILFLFYIFLFWCDWTHVLAESQLSVKHAFMHCEDVNHELEYYVMLLLSTIFNWKIWEEQHWSTQKLADQKSNRSLVSVWTDNSAFLHHVFIKQTNFCASQQMNKCRPM